MNQSTRQSIQNRSLLLAMTVCLLMGALLWGSLTPLAAQGPDASDNTNTTQEQVWQNNFSIAQRPAAVPLGGGMSNEPCIDGFAGPFPCDNMDLLAWIPLPDLGATENPSITNGNDSWGWTDPEDGTEYVIMGHSSGASFLDITEPTNPVIVGHLPPNTAPNFRHLWGDYKVYSNTLYKINESVGEGMQVFDLTELRDASPGTTFEATAVYTGFGNAHNVVVNVDSGYAYAVGTGGDGMDVHCGDAGGLHIVDINDPHNPTFAGCFNEDGYTHDAQCVMYTGPDPDYADAEVCFNANEDSITIVDVSDKMATTLVATQTYGTAAYSHQGWLTDDQQYFLMNDELDEINGVVSGTRTYVWDVSDLDNPTLVGHYQPGNTSIDHNLYIMGNMIYQANYKSGLRVIESNDWATIDFNEVAYFDTYPEDDAAEFSGAWNVYPFFESGVIVVSDFNRGLFLLENTPTSSGPLYNEPCEDGYAGPFPCDNVDLLAWIPLPDLGATENPSITNGNDNWGWTDPEDGTEYVIAGHSSGATFVDISDPMSPVIVGQMMPNSAPNFRHLWGDYKVYSNTLYKINESVGEGMQVFDLTQLRDASPGTDFTASGVYTGFGNAHNVVVNVDSGYAYAVGTGGDGMDVHCGDAGGLHIVDISDPLNPTFAGCFNEDGYTHDAQCVMYQGPDTDYDGAEICFNANEDTITIVDVSDKMAATLVSTQTYGTAAYSHQGWLTEDQQYFLMNDEVDEISGVVTETTTYVWDVSDLDNPTLVGIHESGNAAIDHNLYIIGNIIYQANYASGLRILQGNDWSTADLSEVAYFDTHPEHNDSEFNGIWNAYPFFESGVIALNDFERGMFLVRHNAEVTAVSLSAIDSGTSGGGMGLIMSLFGGFTMLLLGRHFIRRQKRDE